MQSYPLNITAEAPAPTFATEADLFVYVEGAVAERTNYLLWSQAFDNAAWVKTRCSVTTNVAAPDGTATADTLVEDTSVASTHFLSAGATMDFTGLATASVYVKANGRSMVQLLLSGGGSLGVSYDLSTASVLSKDAGVTAAITDKGNGWFLLSMTRAVTAGAVTMLMVPLISAGVSSYTGDGASGLILWQAQIEKGTYVGGVILSGATVGKSGAGSAAIKVKPENGQEIVLKPGQRFRIVGKSQRWYASSADGVSSIAGMVIIGSGEFEDSNTANTFKLDATFANNVKVTNDVNARIPVTLDTSQILNIAGQTVTFTNTFVDDTTAAGTYTAVLPAANVNGLYVELATISLGTAGGFTGAVALVAKATTPGGILGSDVIMTAHCQGGANGNQTNMSLAQRVKIPAGKGLYFVQTSGGGTLGAAMKSVFVTILP